MHRANRSGSIFLVWVLCSIALLSVQPTWAQIPKIKISKLKSKPQPPATENADSDDETPTSQPKPGNRLAAITATSASSEIANQDHPTIARDSVVLITTKGQPAAGYEAPGWVPVIEYRVNGPIESGSHLSVDFALAGKPWVSFSCATQETPRGHSWQVTCGGDEIPAGKQVTYAGPVNFVIHLRNELQGTNTTLFSGKAKVVMVPGPKGAMQMASAQWYVDDDWRMPIGYAFWGKDSGHQDATTLHVGFFVRGDTPELEAHLFYQGKEIAKYASAGNGAADWHPAKQQWGFEDCSFLGLYPPTPPEDEGYDPRFGLREHPGDYEVKVLLVGHLARSIKFTVKPDGSFDNGLAAVNNLGSDRVILPVQVIGNQEPWDKTAWKTQAFYENPLSGFTAP
ncbi:MAG: hypothetical protein JO316_21670 [Abitibacteriaceae bacterium]|nr:hypothetical protein [Abditibacteriaceae bacterium]